MIPFVERRETGGIGYLCPALTSYVSERPGLRPDVLALSSMGQGCGAEYLGP